MSKHIIISNKSWFTSYGKIRTILFLLAISLVVAKGFQYSFLNVATEAILLAVSIALFLTVLLFDYFQKPSFIELSQSTDKLTLRLYIPDTRYLVYFKESAVKSLSVEKEDRLIFQQYKGIIPLLDRIDFVIAKKDGTTLKTEQVNIGWMSEAEKRSLKEAIDRHNGR